jgi:prepilin-type N-terminal cleavage/methylation domain-containing protein
MRGVTLIELMVVLVILGVVTSVGTLAVASLRPSPESKRVEGLSRARAAAARSGHAVTIIVDSGAMVRFLPDGRTVGAGMDPLTGDALHAPR